MKTVTCYPQKNYIGESVIMCDFCNFDVNIDVEIVHRSDNYERNTEGLEDMAKAIAEWTAK